MTRYFWSGINNEKLSATVVGARRRRRVTTSLRGSTLLRGTNTKDGGHVGREVWQGVLCTSSLLQSEHRHQKGVIIVAVVWSKIDV